MNQTIWTFDAWWHHNVHWISPEHGLALGALLAVTLVPVAIWLIRRIFRKKASPPPQVSVQVAPPNLPPETIREVHKLGDEGGYERGLIEGFLRNLGEKGDISKDNLSLLLQKYVETFNDLKARLKSLENGPDADQTIQQAEAALNAHDITLARKLLDQAENEARESAKKEVGRMAKIAMAQAKAAAIQFDRNAVAENYAKAVNWFRPLATDNPAEYEPQLADALHNLSIAYDEVGNREQALASAQDCLALNRNLAEQDPETYKPDLASALNVLSVALDEMGQPTQAMQASMESVEAFRKLADQYPDKFLSDLAISLNNLSGDFFSLGQHQKAIQAVQESVDLYKKMIKQFPDRFLPNLAASLSNLSAFHHALGQHKEAMLASMECVEYFRKLANQYPDKYLPELATILNNLSVYHNALDQHEQAMQNSMECVEIRRKLAEKYPEKFLPDLASSLNNLSIRHDALGQHEQAMQTSRESLEAYRKLAGQYPDKYIPDLANILGWGGELLLKAGNTKDALAAVQEGLKIVEPYAEANPKGLAGQVRARLLGTLERIQAAS